MPGSPWFVGDHFLAIKPWEPYFKASEAKLSSMAVWVKFSKLLIKFYNRSVLKEIGSVIGPVLRIDSYSASGTRGSYARLCVQVDLEKPLINVVRIGKCRQVVLYEGISALCFNCGHSGHTQGNCCNNIKPCEKGGEVGEPSKKQNVGQPGDASKVQDVGQGSQPNPNYGPLMLVTRKRSLVQNGRRPTSAKDNSGTEGHSGKIKYQLVDEDVTSKSSFKTQETMLPSSAREEVTHQVQDESMDTVEFDLLTNKNSREDSQANSQASIKEGSIQKQTQSSKFQTTKSLRIKSFKTLKRQAASIGSKALNNLTSSLLDKLLSKPNGNKLPRIDASPSVKMAI